jgi:hypothetical protein
LILKPQQRAALNTSETERQSNEDSDSKPPKRSLPSPRNPTSITMCLLSVSETYPFLGLQTNSPKSLPIGIYFTLCFLSAYCKNRNRSRNEWAYIAYWFFVIGFVLWCSLSMFRRYISDCSSMLLFRGENWESPQEPLMC